MLSIKVAKIIFSPEHSFRKFKGLTIPLASRFTLLCGHNGVGKSTILGLISSLSGLTSGDKEVKSYFGKLFDASIADIVYVDHAAEVAAPKKEGKLAEPCIYYEIDGRTLVKECSLTRRGQSPRARVVPRNVPHKNFEYSDGVVGPDAKVPLPTLFLGMARMLPVGESPDNRVHNTAEEWHKDDEAFMLRFVQSVIPGSGAKSGEIAVNRIANTKKFSTHPAYPYGPRSVSLGQDSLGAIVTALASFYKLKRAQGASYNGGLLVIDELDAGFHPHAIGVLVRELRKAADELNLQILATSHSTRLIEAIHPDGPSGAKGKDHVIYLRNTRAPEYDSDMSLVEILQDMDLEPPKAKRMPPEVKVYFEDDEACEVFKVVTSKTLIKRLETENNIIIKPMPLGVGCSSLAMLPEKDSYFKTVVLVVDADGQRPKELPPNLADLPGGVDAEGKGLSPERTLIQYVRQLAGEDKSNHPVAWSDSRLKSYSQDSLEANLLSGLPDKLDRKAAKAWWREKKQYFDSWGLYEIWAKAHHELITNYESRFEAAVKAAAKEQRKREAQVRRGQ